MADHRLPPRPEPRTLLAPPEHNALAQARGYQYNLCRGAAQHMMDLNARHASRAWQRRRHDPIAAYVLELLFAQPNPEFTLPPGKLLSGDDWAGAVHLKATTRIWLAGPEARDLPGLLYRLERYVTDHQHADGWSLREQLATSVDDGLRTDARWVGIGVSSLDTLTGTWDQVCHTAPGEYHVPGTIRVLLNLAEPGSPPHRAWIMGERRGMDEFHAKTLHSTHRLADVDLNAPFPYAQNTEHDLITDPWHAPILQRIYGLDSALRRADYFAAPLGLPAKGSLWREVFAPHPHGRPA
jgi:hypothetical protein